ADDARVRTAGDGTDFLQSPLVRQPQGPGPGVGATSAEHAPTLDPTGAPAPPRIGRYRVVRLLGAGGMGVVYEAEQTEPGRRQVALKLIRPGLGSKQILARFEAERQALALMDHPHIARVLDADTTETGRPYFVMELVQGVPLTAFCDQHRLTPRQRLELFV